MRRLRAHTLSLVFLALFAVALAGQSLAGWHVRNQEAVEHREATVGWLRYVVSSDFGQAVLENWQSEYLQFLLFIGATIFLVQRGSPESKAVDQAGRGSDEEQLVGAHARPDSPSWARVGGWRTSLYSYSLLWLMGLLFAGSWIGQSLTAWTVYNEEQRAHGEGGIGWTDYVAGADFWERTLQNWQSEFLAVGSMAVFAVYLRARGSAESKPVGARHSETGV